ACRYCMPCPEGVDIPRYMDMYRQWRAFGLENAVRNSVRRMPEKKSLANCTRCGACTDACPNDLDVPAMLDELGRLAED
ncbi:MAG: 4Fe-4S binding protein, partial [Victivallales bacterium]|nr:4Fe-4S binding protein [Victivallales bacterium]